MTSLGPIAREQAPSPDIELLIVRAGRTCWDETERVQGRTDLPLTDRGRADVIAALEAAAHLVPTRLGVVYTGPDEASEATASLVADRFGGKVKILDELIGWDFGLWHGLQEDELRTRYAKAWERWVADPTAVTPPNGEQCADVQDRIASSIRRAARKAESKQVAMVLRPLQIALLTQWLEASPIANLWTFAHQTPPVLRVRLHPRTLEGRTIAAVAKVGV